MAPANDMQAFSGAAVTTDTAFETRRAVFDALAAALQARRDEASAGGNERAQAAPEPRPDAAARTNRGAA